MIRIVMSGGRTDFRRDEGVRRASRKGPHGTRGDARAGRRVRRHRLHNGGQDRAGRAQYQPAQHHQAGVRRRDRPRCAAVGPDRQDGAGLEGRAKSIRPDAQVAARARARLVRTTPSKGTPRQTVGANGTAGSSRGRDRRPG